MGATAGVSAFARDFYDDDFEASAAASITHRTLIDTQERMGMMLDVMPMGLLIHTEQGILFANQEACRLLGVDSRQAIGQHFLDFIPAAEFDKVRRQFACSFGDDSPMQNQETRIAAADGDTLYIKLISCRLPWDGNPVIQVLLQDVSDLKRTENKLRRLSEVDELSGAYNRRHAIDAARRFLADRESALGVILMDLDHFKAVNDSWGHAAGDAAIVAVARACRRVLDAAALPAAPVFARFGGEEFLVLLPGLDTPQAATLADRLREAIAAEPIVCEPHRFSVTASFGVTSRRARDRSFESVVARADCALYAAKAEGRNRVASHAGAKP